MPDGQFWTEGSSAFQEVGIPKYHFYRFRLRHILSLCVQQCLKCWGNFTRMRFSIFTHLLDDYCIPNIVNKSFPLKMIVNLSSCVLVLDLKQTVYNNNV